MKIILVNKKASKPISIGLHIVLIILVAFIGLNFVLTNYYIKYKKINVNGSYEIYNFNQNQVNSKNQFDVFVQQIGELHTRILQINSQTERLQDVMKKQIVGKEKLPKIKKNKGKGGKGGPLLNDNLSFFDIDLALKILFNEIKERESQYNKMEAILLRQSVLKETLPSLSPVNVPYSSSSFGWRQDPFLGIRAFHSGLDFSAAHGEPIQATAGGIVVESSVASDYGKFVTINHGDGLETRYAHASKIFVKKGDVVRKNDLIGLVGNTGRSTGPHLHYEIRLNDRPLDPKQYIKK